MHAEKCKKWSLRWKHCDPPATSTCCFHCAKIDVSLPLTFFRFWIMEIFERLPNRIRKKKEDERNGYPFHNFILNIWSNISISFWFQQTEMKLVEKHLGKLIVIFFFNSQTNWNYELIFVQVAESKMLVKLAIVSFIWSKFRFSMIENHWNLVQTVD